MSTTPHAGKAKIKATRKRGPSAAVAPVLVTKSIARTALSQVSLGKGLRGIEAHDLVTTGVRAGAVMRFMNAYHIIEPKQVFKVMGISERTLQRAAAKDKPLDSNATDRALRLAAVTTQAINALGSQEAAERWLSEPAIGLDQRRPIELLQSTEGTELVKTLLTRMDYGVYS